MKEGGYVKIKSIQFILQRQCNQEHKRRYIKRRNKKNQLSINLQRFLYFDFNILVSRYLHVYINLTTSE